jgi:hypothetical protein
MLKRVAFASGKSPPAEGAFFFFLAIFLREEMTLSLFEFSDKRSKSFIMGVFSKEYNKENL